MYPIDSRKASWKGQLVKRQPNVSISGRPKRQRQVVSRKSQPELRERAVKQEVFQFVSRIVQKKNNVIPTIDGTIREGDLLTLHAGRSYLSMVVLEPDGKLVAPPHNAQTARRKTQCKTFMTESLERGAICLKRAWFAERTL